MKWENSVITNIGGSSLYLLLVVNAFAMYKPYGKEPWGSIPTTEHMDLIRGVSVSGP